MVGVASTIDNDLMGSDITIGVHTALNIAPEAIDSPEDHRFVTPAGISGGGNGTAVRLSGVDGWYRRRCRGGGHSGGADRP